jgi:peptidoglycan-associated lipoprotein
MTLPKENFMKSEAIRNLSLIALFVLLAGCHPKQVAKAPPPPPAPAPEVAKAPPPAPPPPAREEPKVAEAKPVEAPPPEVKLRIEDLLAKLQDIYFDYDKHIIRPDADATLQANATALREILKQYPGYKLRIEGYCDERGSDEYNLALGDRRAKAAQEFLIRLGIPGDQLETVSFGKEKPVCSEHDESCWQKNRRAHTTQNPT